MNRIGIVDQHRHRVGEYWR